MAWRSSWAGIGGFSTVEDHVGTDGFGAGIRLQAKEPDRVRVLALPDRFIEQGNREVLLERYKISVRGIMEMVEKWNAEA